MAKLGRPRKAETDVKTGRQQAGLMANYEGVMSLDTILKDNLGFLPKEARDEVATKVSGLKIAGKVYARAADVDKALQQFWHDADSPLPVLEADENGKVQAPAVDCESCEELREAKVRASNADQKLKLQETTYKAQFNTLTGQLNKANEERTALEREKASLQREKTRLENQIAELTKKISKQPAQDFKGEIAKLEKALEATVESEKKVRGELTKANARIKELEASASGSGKGDSASKARLKEQIKDLEKLSKTNTEIIQRLTKDREDARNELEELKTSAGTKAVEKLVREKNEFKELFETAADEINEKKKKIDELEAKLKTARAELKNEQDKNKSLQSALDEKPAEVGGGISGIKAGDLFYPEEVLDFIQILAARNADRLENIQDSYKREYDLSKMVAEAIVQSGWQERMREKIEKAAESGDMRQYYRIGFEDADGTNHEKLYYHGDSRYAVVMAVTPSDIRAGLNAASVQKNMLCIAPVKGE